MGYGFKRFKFLRQKKKKTFRFVDSIYRLCDEVNRDDNCGKTSPLSLLSIVYNDAQNVGATLKEGEGSCTPFFSQTFNKIKLDVSVSCSKSLHLVKSSCLILISKAGNTD